MDIAKEFEDFKKIYAERYHLPIGIIREGKPHWSKAWEVFLKEVMVPKWDETKDYFLNLKTIREEEREEIEETETPSYLPQNNAWDEVKKYLK